MTMYPIARWLRQDDIPDCPEDFKAALGGANFPIPVSSTTRRHLKNLLRSSALNRRAARTFVGILQGVKRGCDAVPAEFIFETMEKHKSALSKVLPELSSEDTELYRRKFRDLFHVEVRRGKWKAYLTRSIKRRGGNPNFHACVTHNRAQLGRAAAARDFIRGELEDQCDWATSTDPLISMTEIRPGVVVESRFGTNLLPSVSPKWLTSRAANKVRARAHLEAKVSACLEPLKCRLITKGEGVPYLAAMPLQKLAWEWLSSKPQFALIREPLNTSHLEWILKREEDTGLKGLTHWVSGDYSAATDGLSQEINQLALSEFLHSVRATSDERLICQKVLGNHKITYPAAVQDDGTKKRVPGFTQSCGQLMGCPLSFPILCAINVVAYWAALEEYTSRTFKVEELPVLVNGDDILFRANPDFYEIWKRHVKTVGFTLSPGKNYISEHFLTANSAAYLHFKGDATRAHRFELIPYLNTGLLYSSYTERQKRTVGLRNELRALPFTQLANQLVDGAADKPRAMRRFISLFKSDITKYTGRGARNLFAAVPLGGLGVQRPEGFTTSYTFLQRQLAGFLRRKWKAIAEESTIDTSLSSIKLEDAHGFREVTAPRLLTRVTDIGTGQVVLRDKWEPLREFESRLPELETVLLNYQNLPDATEWNEEKERFELRDTQLKMKFTKLQLSLKKEFEELVRTFSPNEKTPDPIGDRLHKIETFEKEYRVITSTLRTDSKKVAVYRDPSGSPVYVPSSGLAL